MKIGRVLSASVLTMAMAGLAAAQGVRSVEKPQPLRNANPNAKQRSQVVQSPNFGGTVTLFQRISATQFVADVASDGLTSTWNPPGITDYQRWFSGAGFNHLVSSPTLPGGARITYVELDACDASTSDLHVQLNVYNCDYLGVCDDTPLTTLTSASDTVNPCAFPNTNIDQRVFNYTGQTLFDVTFGETNGLNTFAGVVIGYVLEPTPAPAVATFGDVPTNHIFFQFIEALAASGVTGGCQAAPPLYCPNNFVTRGQMATFLSKLVGLGVWESF